MHRLVVLAALALAVSILAASCIADVSDAPDEPTEGELGLKPGGGGGPISPPPDPITAARWWRANHKGPCADACWNVGIGRCEACMEGDEEIECVGVTLTCIEAEHALSGPGVLGLEACWRSCQGLH
jgi:hypothetical protein